jgi:hypothetical protein
VQLCKLEETPWVFLQGVKNSGVPIPRSALVQRALKDAQLVEILSQYVQSTLELVVQRPGSTTAAVSSHSLTGANKILSFYTAVVLEMAEDRPFDDARVRHVYLFLVEGLKNKYVRRAGSYDASGEVDVLDQWRRACCMILVQFSIRTPFGKPLMKVMSGALSEALRRSLTSAAAGTEPSASTVEVVSTMCILAQQDKFRIGGKVLANLLGPSGEQFAHFLAMVSAIKTSYNVAPFTALLASALSEELCTTVPSRSDDAAQEDSAPVLTPATLSAALNNLLASDLPDANVVRGVLTTLLSTVSQQPSAQAMAGIKASLQCIAQRFAADFEHTVAQQLTAADAASHAALTAFLSEVFASTDLQHHKTISTNAAQGSSAAGTSGGLLLSLTSAIPSVRAQALSAFASLVSLTAAPTADVLGLVHAAAQSLLDPIVEVASAAWSVPVLQRVATFLSAGELLEVFTTALAFWSASARAAATTTTGVTSAGQKLVHAIFAVLAEDSTVLEKLLQTETSAAWLFEAAVGSALRSTGGDNELAQAAAKALKHAASHSAALAAFSTITVKAGAAQEVVAKAVTNAVLSAKFLQHEGNSSLLCAGATSAHKAVQTDARSLSHAAALLHLLVSAVEALQKADREEEATVLMHAATPLLLSALQNLRDGDHNSAGAVESVLSATGAFAQLVAQVEAPVSVEGDLSQMVAAFSAPIVADNLSARLLIGVLTAASARVARHLGAVLQALQPATVWAPLLRLVLTTQQDAARDTQLTVPAAARYAALQALAAYLAGAALPFKSANGASKSASSSKSASAQDSQLFVLLLAVTVQLCGEAAEQLRSVGLVLAARLSTLAAHVILPTGTATNGGLNTANAVQLVRTVCDVLTARAAIIAVEPFAATTALTAEVFESGANNVAASLCWLAAQFGWTAPQYALPIITAARGVQLSTTWSHLQSLIASATGSSDGAEALADALVTAVQLGYPDASAEVQARVVASIAATVQSNPTSRAAVVLKDRTVEFICGGVFATASTETRQALYDALLQEQVQRPGQKHVLTALAAVHVDLSASTKLLTDVLGAFNDQYQQLAHSAAQEADAEGNGEDAISGLSVPLQQILSVLEAVAAAFAGASAEVDGPALGALSARLFDFLAQLNDPRLRSVMLVDYSKALTMDTVHTALSVAGKHALSTSSASKKSASSAKKTAAQNGNDATGYALARVDGDVRLLLSSITATKASTVQTASLRLLKVLLALNPASVVPSMQALGELLAASSTHMQAGKEGLVEQILRTFVTFLPEAGAASGADGSAMPQYLLQSLCQHFYVMPHHRRGALLKMALGTMKAPATLAVAVNLLLVHSYVAHEVETSTTNAGAARNAATNSTEGSEDAMILLSKSAHRRAQRELKASVPEELFSLATELMLMRTPNTQVNVIIALLSGAHRLLDVALGNASELSHSAVGGNTEDAQVDTTASLTYCNNLLRAHPATAASAHASAHSDRGHAATLAILHLELIIEVLENRTFHQLLVAAADASGSTAASVVQEYFMSFADGVLQLLAMSSAVEQGLGAGRTKELLTLCVDGTQIRLPPKALGKHITGWCYEAQRTLQRLMDGPSFVVSSLCPHICFSNPELIVVIIFIFIFQAIIQELINHEQTEVRQKALVILGERLEGMSAGKLKDETEVSIVIVRSFVWRYYR